MQLLKLNERYSLSDRYFPKGHLLEFITRGATYLVIKRDSRAGLLIIDDIGREVWISNNTKARFFD